MKVLSFKREPSDDEGARRASEESDGSSVRKRLPDPEVKEKASRRRFTAAYKLRILEEVNACKGDGDIGALLRREGLYSSHLALWRRQKAEIGRKGMSSKRRGRKELSDEEIRMRELEKENQQLRNRLKKAEMIIEIQKKTSELLGLELESRNDSEGN
jgi:transposase-like protein